MLLVIKPATTLFCYCFDFIHVFFLSDQNQKKKSVKMTCVVKFQSPYNGSYNLVLTNSVFNYLTLSFLEYTGVKLQQALFKHPCHLMGLEFPFQPFLV